MLINKYAQLGKKANHVESIAWATVGFLGFLSKISEPSGADRTDCSPTCGDTPAGALPFHALVGPNWIPSPP